MKFPKEWPERVEIVVFEDARTPGVWLAKCDAIGLLTQGDSMAQAVAAAADSMRCVTDECEKGGAHCYCRPVLDDTIQKPAEACCKCGVKTSAAFRLRIAMGRKNPTDVSNGGKETA